MSPDRRATTTLSNPTVRTAVARVSLPVVISLLLLVTPGVDVAVAQDVGFSPLMPARQATSLLLQGDDVLMGLEAGGLLIWNRDDPLRPPVRVHAGEGLTHNRVTDLAYSGINVWVATDGGGLTRISNLDGTWEYRGFSTNLADLDLTAVAGQIVGGSEWVFYGIDDGGVGRITNGVPGAVYTAAQDGLPSDDVRDMIFLGGELFVATTEGVTRFLDNVFVDAGDGLPANRASSFTITPVGGLVAGTETGLASWDPATQTWSTFGSLVEVVNDVAATADGVWALSQDGSRLVLVTASEVTEVAQPVNVRATAITAETDLWIGGRFRVDEMAPNSALAYLGRRSVPEWTGSTIDAPLVRNADGVTFDASGRAWIGSRVGDALAGAVGGGWRNIYEIGTAENGFAGLYNHAGGMLGVGAEVDGAVWFGQFDSGLIRYVPAEVSGGAQDFYERVNPDTSPLQGRLVERVVTHPRGPLVFTSISHHADVLVDPGRWSSPGNWVNLDDDVLGGAAISDAIVERNDVLWFSVVNQGLMRWDVNGATAGPDDPLTWTDPSDDTWHGPITSFEFSAFDPTQVVAMARAADGTIWAGGGGILRFEYSVIGAALFVTKLEEYGEKTSTLLPGLLAQGVTDLQVDRNGDLWVLSGAGLNRVRDADNVVIDAWTDLATFVANPQFGALYSPNIIAALPGGTYRKLAVSPDRSSLLLSSSFGATQVAIAAASTEEQGALDQFFAYPNPYPGDGDGQLRLGGLTADESADDPATVEIYNLEGQLVYRNRFVTAEVGFWNGQNRYGEPIAAGLYMLKVSYRGATQVRTLAIER